MTHRSVAKCSVWQPQDDDGGTVGRKNIFFLTENKDAHISCWSRPSHWSPAGCSAVAAQALICLIALSRGGGGIFNFYTTLGVDQMLSKERPSKHLWLSTDGAWGAAAVQSTSEARRRHLHLTATFCLHAQLTVSLRLHRDAQGDHITRALRGRSLWKKKKCPCCHELLVWSYFWFLF